MQYRAPAPRSPIRVPPPPPRLSSPPSPPLLLSPLLPPLQRAKRRRRADQTKEVHCCEADPEDEREMWARVRSFDEEGSEANPGKLIYLPVTLIRQSKVTLLAPAK